MSAQCRVRCPNGHVLKLNGSVKPASRLRCPKCGTRFRIAEPKQGVKGKGHQRQPQEGVNPYALDNPLLALGKDDAITLRDLLQNVLAVGRTGSGKTSSIVPLILGALLKPAAKNGPQAGGYFFCVKNDDAETYRRIVQQSGRADDLVEISLESGDCFNPFIYEMEATGDNGPNSCVELFDLLTRIVDQGKGDGGERYWRFATKTLLRNALLSLMLAGIPVTLLNLIQLVTSIPDLANGELDEGSPFREVSFCVHVSDLIETRYINGELNEVESEIYADLGRYWYVEVARQDFRHKGGYISGFTALAASFTCGGFRELFNGEENSIDLSEAYEKGKIFIFNIPVQQHQEIARMAMGILRRCSMREIERRIIPDIEAARPVVFCCDEYAQLADGEYDQLFTSASRAKKCVTFNLCQSVDQIYDVMRSKERAHALLANLKLKFFLANDGETAEYASKLIGKRWSMLGNSGTQLGGAGQGFGGGQEAQVEHKIPADFFGLRSGGPDNDMTVDAVLFNGGEAFSTGSPFLDIAIPQHVLEAK